MPVLIDSGFRRGTDIVKALCMGAKGVAVGRPYLWGLGAFGQPGVERVLEHPAHRADGRDAAGRRAGPQAPRPGDGEARLTFSPSSLTLRPSPRARGEVFCGKKS